MPSIHEAAAAGQGHHNAQLGVPGGTTVHVVALVRAHVLNTLTDVRCVKVHSIACKAQSWSRMSCVASTKACEHQVGWLGEDVSRSRCICVRG